MVSLGVGGVHLSAELVTFPAPRAVTQAMEEES